MPGLTNTEDHDGPAIWTPRSLHGQQSPTAIDGLPGSDGEADPSLTLPSTRHRLDGVYKKLRAHLSPSRVRRVRRSFPPDGLLYKNYFTEQQLLALEQYKHSGVDLSITYKHVLSPLYARLVHLLPMWLAPNTVTLLGILPVLLAHCALLAWSPGLDAEAPRVLHALAGACLFFYQVMDNLDGKQARRTGSSSPLGHLFDHLCDALNVTLSGISAAASLALGKTWWSLVLVFGNGFLLFYTGTLEEYVSGKMVLRQINGPNEGLLLVQAIHFATALFGISFWTHAVQLPLPGTPSVQRNHLLVLTSVPLIASTVFYNFFEAARELRRRGTPALQVADRIARPSLPLLWFLGAAVGWAYLSPAVVRDHAVLFLWTFGLQLFYLVNTMILAHLTRSVFPAFVPNVAPLGLGVANVLVGGLLRRHDGAHVVPEGLLLWALLLASLCGNVRRVYCMCLQLCEYLGISVFRITKKQTRTD